MSVPAFKPRLGLALALLAAVSPLWVAAPAGAAETLFDNLPGTWSGDGVATIQDGSKERIRCHARYMVAPSGTTMHQDLNCASDSYKIDMKSDILYQNGALAGTWIETGRQVNGSIVGRVEGDTITTKVSGLTFHADVSIVTRNNKQSIRIISEGAWAKAVAIDLRAN